VQFAATIFLPVSYLALRLFLSSSLPLNLLILGPARKVLAAQCDDGGW